MFKNLSIGVLALLLTACGALKPRHAAPPSPAESVPRPGLPPGRAYRVDENQSELRILVYRAGPLARFGHNHVIVNHAIRGAVSLADIVYTDAWVSMGQEAEVEARNAALAPYQVNEALMAKCFRALAPGGLIAVKDHIMNRDLTEPAAGAVFALYLLLTTRGRDYSFDETAGWLGAAGFIDIQLTTLPSPPFTSSIVSARKP